MNLPFKLTSQEHRTTDQKIDRALVDLLAEHVKHTTLVGCAMITIVGAGLWLSFPVTQVLGWVLVGYLVAIPRLMIIQRTVNSLSPDHSRSTLEWTIGLILFISGLHWGAAGWLFLDTNNVQHFALVCGAILGVIASSLAMFSTRPLISCLFAYTVLGIVAVKLATEGNWGLSVMCLVALLGYTVASKVLGRRIE